VTNGGRITTNTNAVVMFGIIPNYVGVGVRDFAISLNIIA
jgi:hypothetical protein